MVPFLCRGANNHFNGSLPGLFAGENPLIVSHSIMHLTLSRVTNGIELFSLLESIVGCLQVGKAKTMDSPARTKC